MSAPKTPPCGAEARAEALVQRLGDLARRGGDVGRAVALARVAVERELADDDDLALAERLVHAAFARRGRRAARGPCPRDGRRPPRRRRA